MPSAHAKRSPGMTQQAQKDAFDKQKADELAALIAQYMDCR